MGRGWGEVVRARLTGWGREARLPGGDEGLAKVQWTFAPKNARPVGGPGGRRMRIWRMSNQEKGAKKCGSGSGRTCQMNCRII